MLSKVDMEDIMTQLQHKTPTLQVVREYGIGHPPMLEQYCSLLPEGEQIPTLGRLVRIEAERVSVVGIENWEQLEGFLGIVECYRKNGWIDVDELDTILIGVRRWIDARDERQKVDESEAALQRIAFGLSHRMF